MFNNSKLSFRKMGLLLMLTSMALLAACNAQVQNTGTFAQIPAGKAYSEGKEIFFTHTEASDPGIAEKLTNMMKSPVIYVASLAKVPTEALANVYVFENGLAGKGPLGFQPDVFNYPPDTDGYTPLRQIILVKWAEGVKALELKSETEILAAKENGELNTQESGVVVNMPFLVWEGGKR